MTDAISNLADSAYTLRDAIRELSYIAPEFPGGCRPVRVNMQNGSLHDGFQLRGDNPMLHSLRINYIEAVKAEMNICLTQLKEAIAALDIIAIETEITGYIETMETAK